MWCARVKDSPASNAMELRCDGCGHFFEEFELEMQCKTCDFRVCEDCEVDSAHGICPCRGGHKFGSPSYKPTKFSEPAAPDAERARLSPERLFADASFATAKAAADEDEEEDANVPVSPAVAGADEIEDVEDLEDEEEDDGEDDTMMAAVMAALGGGGLSRAGAQLGLPAGTAQALAALMGGVESDGDDAAVYSQIAELMGGALADDDDDEDEDVSDDDGEGPQFGAAGREAAGSFGGGAFDASGRAP